MWPWTWRAGACLLVLASATAPAQAPVPSQAPPRVPTPFSVPRLTPEGAGAPVIGQPGDQVPPAARSPNKRILPVTREPGLWAADEPQAASRRSPELPPRTVDELLVATPSPGAPEAKGCRQRLLRASRSSGHEETRRNLPQTPRDCLTARLVLHCVSSESTAFETQALNTPRIDGRNFLAEHKGEIDAVFYWQMRLCKNTSSLPPIEVMFSEIVATFERQSRRYK
ncbi:hypothetical protein CYFUS_005784 [Cystobacter fuscus]|uniref:Lipoprotein n=1 Tax=Cystobacter fuscus TaxID=43 RepID=A0A250J8V9_9BACT|nr:hypothetical protein CYFUS_005784 [Cystobacter fuscus]